MAEEKEAEGLEIAPINTEDHRALLVELLAKNGLGPESLELVDSFPNDPYRATKVQKVQRVVQIVKTVSPEQRLATLDVVLGRFEEKELIQLLDDWLFLKHRVLSGAHQIQNRWKTEYECDKWAFYELKR